MLIRYTVGGKRCVWLTDNPEEAREAGRSMPVIGITGPEPEYELWSGVSYLAESEEAVTQDYAERVSRRFAGEPVVILEGEDWRLREMCSKDLDGLQSMYRDPQVLRFLEHPLMSGEQTEGAWQDWQDAYRRYVYQADGPAMWVIADAQDHFLGRLGLEWKCVNGLEGYYLGFGLLPEARGRGLITRAGRVLLSRLYEWWELDTVYLACEKENQASAACAKRLGFKFISQIQDTMVFCISVNMSASTPLT